MSHAQEVTSFTSVAIPPEPGGGLGRFWIVRAKRQMTDSQ